LIFNQREIKCRGGALAARPTRPLAAERKKDEARSIPPLVNRAARTLRASSRRRDTPGQGHAPAGRSKRADGGTAPVRLVIRVPSRAAWLDAPSIAPGSVYTASVDDHGKVGLCRLEVGCSPGTGKLRIAGGVEGPMRESINRAFAYLMGQKVKMGVGHQIDTTDFHVEAIDLLSNHVPSEAGIALVVAVYSAIQRQSVQAGLVVLGDLSIQGNIKSVRSLAEPLQVAMDNGARRALVPLENKRNFLEVSGDIVERVDPIFFSDPMMAAMKALGMA
jgi:predicted ATP-dependent Lon-type protease